MFFKKSILFVIVALFFATSFFAQVQTDSVKKIGKVWLQTVKNNPQFLNPDKIMPGDTVRVTVGNETVQFIANPDSLNSQWAVTVAAMQKISKEKQLPININVSPREKEFPWMIAVISLVVGAVLLLAILFLIAYLSSKKLKKQEVLEKETNFSPFVENVPSINTPDSEILPIVMTATEAVYGNGFEIVPGTLQRGTADGVLRVLHSNGEWTNETLNNEPAVRALIRFDNGKEKWLVYKFQCFNIFFGSLDGEFEGTFTPEDSFDEEQISNISSSEFRETSSNVKKIADGGKPDLSKVSFEESIKLPESANQKENIPAAPKELVNLTKLQVSSDKGLNLEGEFSLEVNDLKEILEKFAKK